MARVREGRVIERDGKHYARIRYTDEQGIRRDKWYRAETVSKARSLLKEKIKELDGGGSRLLDAERMSFADLVKHYEENYVTEPVYVDSRKVSGLRDHLRVKGMVGVLKAHFGKTKLRAITYGDLRTFKALRLKTPKSDDGQRAIASVNRELATLRRMLNVALAEGWILKNPFNSGGSLISIADERKRERILSRAEESAMLEACELVDKSGRHSCRHLRPILICALDSAMRFGEIRSLCWRDVNIEEKLITVQAFNTKTMRERTISMTTRLADELAGLWEKSPKDPDLLVFGILSSVKKAFAAVCRQAKIEGLRFHDLRHTAATRLVEGHLPLQEVGRVLGHTLPSTTYRYVNANEETARRAAAVLDALNARAQEAAQVQSEAVN